MLGTWWSCWFREVIRHSLRLEEKTSWCTQSSSMIVAVSADSALHRCRCQSCSIMGCLTVLPEMLLWRYNLSSLVLSLMDGLSMEVVLILVDSTFPGCNAMLYTHKAGWVTSSTLRAFQITWTWTSCARLICIHVPFAICSVKCQTKSWCLNKVCSVSICISGVVMVRYCAKELRCCDMIEEPHHDRRQLSSSSIFLSFRSQSPIEMDARTIPGSWSRLRFGMKLSFTRWATSSISIRDFLVGDSGMKLSG